MASSEYPDRLAENFAGIARLLYTPDTLGGTLQRIVECAVDTIEGCEYASIFLMREGRVRTPASSAPLAAKIDVLQSDAGEGPCLDVMNHGVDSLYAQDLLEDPRWPVFGPRAAAAGMRSVLSYRLFADDTLGALNLYAPLPHAYGATDRASGLIFATHAGIAVSGAEARSEAQRAEHLEAALASRELIGQAQGILMEREHIIADLAFEVLNRASQNLNVKLRDVAQRLVDTGERPRTESDQAPPR